MDAAEREAQEELRRTTAALQGLYPAASPLALDLVARMLAFDPARRITVEAALVHPYLQGAAAALHRQKQEEEEAKGGRSSSSSTSSTSSGHSQQYGHMAARLWTPAELQVLQSRGEMSCEEVKQGLWEAIHKYVPRQMRELSGVVVFSAFHLLRALCLSVYHSLITVTNCVGQRRPSQYQC